MHTRTADAIEDIPTLGDVRTMARSAVQEVAVAIDEDGERYAVHWNDWAFRPQFDRFLSAEERAARDVVGEDCATCGVTICPDDLPVNDRMTGESHHVECYGGAGDSRRHRAHVTVRQRLEKLRTRWRRWRLLRAYSRVFQARTGKRVGFTGTMAAYDHAERDGVLSLEDGEVVWYWL